MNIIRNLEETLKKPPRELAYAYPLILPTYSVTCIRYVYPVRISAYVPHIRYCNLWFRSNDPEDMNGFSDIHRAGYRLL